MEKLDDKQSQACPYLGRGVCPTWAAQVLSGVPVELNKAIKPPQLQCPVRLPAADWVVYQSWYTTPALRRSALALFDSLFAAAAHQRDARPSRRSLVTPITGAPAVYHGRPEMGQCHYPAAARLSLPLLVSVPLLCRCCLGLLGRASSGRTRVSPRVSPIKH